MDPEGPTGAVEPDRADWPLLTVSPPLSRRSPHQAAREAGRPPPLTRYFLTAHFDTACTAEPLTAEPGTRRASGTRAAVAPSGLWRGTVAARTFGLKPAFRYIHVCTAPAPALLPTDDSWANSDESIAYFPIASLRTKWLTQQSSMDGLTQLRGLLTGRPANQIAAIREAINCTITTWAHLLRVITHLITDKTSIRNLESHGPRVTLDLRALITRIRMPYYAVNLTGFTSHRMSDGVIL